MKTRFLVVMSLLLIGSALTLHAQNTLPDPNNNACWQSFEALRACQIDQYNRELKYEQSCTSYPEYQCNPSTTNTNANSEFQQAKSKRRGAGPNTIANQFSRMTNLTPTTPASTQAADSK
jgi:hypothetical protein